MRRIASLLALALLIVLLMAQPSYAQGKQRGSGVGAEHAHRDDARGPTTPTDNRGSDSADRPTTPTADGGNGMNREGGPSTDPGHGRKDRGQDQGPSVRSADQRPTPPSPTSCPHQPPPTTPMHQMHQPPTTPTQLPSSQPRPKAAPPLHVGAPVAVPTVVITPTPPVLALTPPAEVPSTVALTPPEAPGAVPTAAPSYLTPTTPIRQLAMTGASTEDLLATAIGLVAVGAILTRLRPRCS
jgi:hypothetical protein